MLVELAAWSGLRWGELVVLTRSDIDMMHGTLSVTKALVETTDGFLLGPPKTQAGRRVVTIPPHLMPRLQKHLAAYAGAGPDALVFCGARGAQLRRRNFNTLWREIRVSAGVPDVHFHDLRHLAATLAAISGATTRELMARMGHASPRAAMIYQHATASRDALIAVAMSELAVDRRDKAVGDGQVIHMTTRRK
jgi:integrase